MMTRHIAVYAVALIGVIAMQSSSAHALSMTECSAKYKAAKAAGTLNGMKWNDFRRAQCGSEATATPATVAAPAPAPSPAPRLSPGTVGNAVSRVPLIPDIRIGPLVKREWKPVSINTEPTRRIMPTAD
jgi:hypothetical protein